MVYEKGCMMLSRCLQEEKNQHQIQLKLSTIFKYEAINSYQAFGSFYDTNGEKYCAVSVLLKYLGYDIAIVSKQIQNKENSNLEELIPDAILEKVASWKVSMLDFTKVADCSGTELSTIPCSVVFIPNASRSVLGDDVLFGISKDVW